MTAPGEAAHHFAAAWLIGCLVGIWYEFLRPLRPRFTALSDGLFLLGLLAGWLRLGFGVICWQDGSVWGSVSAAGICGSATLGGWDWVPGSRLWVLDRFWGPNFGGFGA